MIIHHGFSQKKEGQYTVARVNEPVNIDADWDKPVWKKVEALTLNYHMGEKPNHFPKVQAKIAYDSHNVYLIWKVEDQFIRAVAENHQGPVFKDSCVEFFFIPDNLGANEYFNLEMNCGGTMLFHHQDHEDRSSTRVSISNEDIAKMKVAHSLPRMIPDEIQEKTTWYLEYSIPFQVLDKYYSLETPGSGTRWKANLYKCADDTSHPHWLTWSPIDFPRPNFHLPQFFGQLVFE